MADQATEFKDNWGLAADVNIVSEADILQQTMIK